MQPIASALEKNAEQQLAGVMASVQVPISKLLTEIIGCLKNFYGQIRHRHHKYMRRKHILLLA